MTRRSRREIERAVEDLATDTDAPDRCDDCGRLPPGRDGALGVTADWVTYECTCNRPPPPSG